jgi:hypothetical protein
MEIRQYESVLRAAGQVACIVIATDGEASDGDIMEALRPLQQLPVMIVLRLCTDESKTVEYWNDVEKDLEMRLDVLDDWCGEASEVKRMNGWLTYGEPLHRMRESGMMMKELDSLDESVLSFESFQRVCEMLYGKEEIDVAVSRNGFAASCSSTVGQDVEDDYEEDEEEDDNEVKCGNTVDFVTIYLNAVSQVIASSGTSSQVWCPESNRMRPWISISDAKAFYQQNIPQQGGKVANKRTSSWSSSVFTGSRVRDLFFLLFQAVVFIKLMQFMKIW